MFITSLVKTLTSHRRPEFLVLLALVFVTASTLSAQRPADGGVSARLAAYSKPASAEAPRIHRDIRTADPRANRNFDEGLSLHYAYRHTAAIAAFREAQRVDARCVMCHVGEAIALGPTIDSPLTASAAVEALGAIERAAALVHAGAGSPSDAAWLRAVSARYQSNGMASRAQLDSAYAHSMAALADANPVDADAQTLAAEAAMILTPFNYWSPSGAALPGTRRALARLRQAMRVAPGHHGACFLYVHLMESVQPWVKCAGDDAGRR